MKTIQKSGLNCKLSKCSFAYTKIKFLGHLVSHAGIQPDPAKVKAVKKFPETKTLKDARSFLGLANYYRKFIEKYTILAQPLYDVTGNSAKNLVWDKEQQQAFQNLKDALTSDKLIKPFDVAKPKFLHTDGLYSGLGAVLEQEHENKMFFFLFKKKSNVNASIRILMKEKKIFLSRKNTFF